MTLEDIKKELMSYGHNPNDFNIKITETGYSVIPKWYYEQKQVAQQEDVPIMIALTESYETQLINDANREQENIDGMVALTEVYELLIALQSENEQLKQRVTQLEGGTV